MSPLAVKCVLLGILAAVSLYSFNKARSSKPDEKTFGIEYIVFMVLLVYIVLVMSRMPIVSAVTDTCVEVIDWASENIAKKLNNEKSSKAVATPSGNPNDYITWTDHLTVQPKAGTSLPTGWYVSFTTANNANFQRINGTTTVPDELLKVYFDPDPSVLPGAASTVPVDTNGRP